MKPADNDTSYFIIPADKSDEVLYVHKRPGLEWFLSELHKFADVSVFTAGMREYAD